MVGVDGVGEGERALAASLCSLGCARVSQASVLPQRARSCGRVDDGPRRTSLSRRPLTVTRSNSSYWPVAGFIVSRRFLDAIQCDSCLVRSAVIAARAPRLTQLLTMLERLPRSPTDVHGLLLNAVYLNGSRLDAACAASGVGSVQVAWRPSPSLSCCNGMAWLPAKIAAVSAHASSPSAAVRLSEQRTRGQSDSSSLFALEVAASLDFLLLRPTSTSPSPACRRASLSQNQRRPFAPTPPSRPTLDPASPLRNECPFQFPPR